MADIPARTDADIEADLGALKLHRMNPGGVSGESPSRIGHRLLNDVPSLLARAQKAEAERDEARQLADSARMLGPARRLLDRIAEGEHVSPEVAADLAQRIVNLIGHPVTDEPPHALVELADRRREAELRRRQFNVARDQRDAAQAEADRLRAELAEAKAENERLRDLVAEFRKIGETQDRIRNRLTAERDAAVAKVRAVEAAVAAALAQHPDDMTAIEVRAALASAVTPEPTLPDDWFHRDGLTDDGSRFTYCSAEGPEKAHCVRPQHADDGHVWAWFTHKQRARAEAATPELSEGEHA